MQWDREHFIRRIAFNSALCLSGVGGVLSPTRHPSRLFRLMFQVGEEGTVGIYLFARHVFVCVLVHSFDLLVLECVVFVTTWCFGKVARKWIRWRWTVGAWYNQHARKKSLSDGDDWRRELLLRDEIACVGVSGILVVWWPRWCVDSLSLRRKSHYLPIRHCS